MLSVYAQFKFGFGFIDVLGLFLFNIAKTSQTW